MPIEIILYVLGRLIIDCLFASLFINIIIWIWLLSIGGMIKFVKYIKGDKDVRRRRQ